ncbi:hypothetical protein [Acetobacter ascendens]|uniref:Uncharacterized protein n=1 Tax=Acetobacter ascendens TaxID=481146 RepID=A0A1Y0V1U5_9PROT|nr:hypothetical protein [Acetobacter ascendens]ARW11724.1 hypothetical protein S101447_02686 [Acetobacter ascendens]
MSSYSRTRESLIELIAGELSDAGAPASIPKELALLYAEAVAIVDGTWTCNANGDWVGKP